MEPAKFLSRSERLDRYLANCVRARLSGDMLPPWPEEIDAFQREISERISFHGISLVLADAHDQLADWPGEVVASLRTEARLQAVWESDHKRAIARLVEALHRASFSPVVMKGTALAYSVYEDPAQRRRGDTDLLVECGARKQVREVFRKCGFEATADRQPLQESWAYQSNTGFSHQVDLHWAISATQAVCQAFEGDHPRNRIAALPRLSPNAFSTGPVDTFIHICVNRLAHDGFGYFVEDRRVLSGNRLIWALDLHLLTRRFSSGDWQSLERVAVACSAVPEVVSGIRFAQSWLGTDIPEGVIERLANCRDRHDRIHRYFAESSPFERMKLDLAASRGMKAKGTVLSRHFLLSRSFMSQRYPGSEKWPLPFLQMRRLLDAGTRMLLGAKR